MTSISRENRTVEAVLYTLCTSGQIEFWFDLNFGVHGVAAEEVGHASLDVS